MTGIYQIQSTLFPSKTYVGSALDISGRWSRHIYSLRLNKHHSSKLQRHYNKYGKNDLVFSVLILCDKEDLIKVEQDYLDILKPHFNICKIAGSSLGRKHSIESRIKSGKSISKSHKIYKALFGVPRKPALGKHWKLSEETKEKHRQASLGNKGRAGKPHTEETKNKMKAARAKRNKI